MYTPTTEDVAYWYEGQILPQIRREEFDRWLNKVKADVWEEGLRLAVGGLPPHTTVALFSANPYKESE